MDDQFSPNDDVLFVLANRVAEAFEGSVAIEDLARTVLAYSTVEGQLIGEVRTTGILMRKVPDDTENDQQYRSVLTSRNEVRFPPTAFELARVAIAIKAGAIPLGTLWVVDRHPDRNLTDDQRTLLSHVVTQAAPVLLGREKQLTARDLPRKRLFFRLLTEPLDTDLREALTSIEFPRSGALLFLYAQGLRDLAVWHRFGRTLAASLFQVAPAVVAVETSLGWSGGAGSFSGEPDAGLCTFIPGAHLSQIQAAIDQVQHLVQLHGNEAVRCIVTSRFLNVEDLRDAHEYTRAFLRSSLKITDAATSVNQVVELNDHHSSIVSGELTAAFTARPWLRNTTIATFCEEHPESAHTSHVWCEELGNVARTAKRLHIHENTVRFRLEKARSNYGIPLTSLDDLMAFATQYRSCHINQ